MDQRRIGQLDVSVVGLGCNNFGRRIDAAESERVVHAALDAGVTLFDTSDTYGSGQSETYLGRALRGRRHEAVIASKFGKPVDGAPASATAEYIRTSIEGSLQRLAADHIDLYQIHEPHPEVPLDETLGALDELVRAGKVREIGCSNFSAQQLQQAEEAARAKQRTRFVSVQNEYSLLEREPENGVLDACERLDIAFIPYFPLASGLLTGKYRRDRELPAGTRITSGGWGADRLSDESLAVVERLIAVAGQRGHTLLELAFSWLLARQRVVSVIAGATKPEQVRANARAAAWRLSADDLRAVDAALAAAA